MRVLARGLGWAWLLIATLMDLELMISATIELLVEGWELGSVVFRYLRQH